MDELIRLRLSHLIKKPGASDNEVVASYLTILFRPAINYCCYHINSNSNPPFTFNYSL